MTRWTIERGRNLDRNLRLAPQALARDLLPAAFAWLPHVVSLRDFTPPDFHFAVKGSRFLTHMKKLNNAADGLKLGPILFQLTPN